MLDLLGRAGSRALTGVRDRADDRRHRLPTLRTGEPWRAPRLWFLVPDWDRPAGGLRTIYRHVDILNAAGLPASVLHTRRGFRLSWFENQTVVHDIGSMVLGPADLLVVPEVYGGGLAGLPPAVRHVVFNQSGHLTWLRDAAAASTHYRTHPSLAGVVVVSEHSRQLLEYAFPELPITRVRQSVDERFRPPDTSRPRRIAYMPRRAKVSCSIVLELLRARGALAGWELAPLSGLTHEEVAEALRESQVFLNFTEQEGFGLPAAEAMATGCYVVGFHGYGGREFFRADFSSPVESGDVLAFAQKVERALAMPESWRAERGLAASKFVHDRYSSSGEREDVVGFYSRHYARV